MPIRVKNFFHTHLQNAFLTRYPFFQKEVFFKQVSRRADLFWPQKGLIVELQCSDISFETLMARNSCYRRLGFNTLWIFHQTSLRSYKKKQLISWWKKRPFFELAFTSLSPNGEGEIYLARSLLASFFTRFFPITFCEKKKSGYKIQVHPVHFLKKRMLQKIHGFLTKNRSLNP